jgi:arylsulfatase
LGLRKETNPAARGFDRSFALLPGCHNHWAWEPQFYEPSSFFEKIPPLYTEDGEKIEMYVSPHRMSFAELQARQQVE